MRILAGLVLGGTCAAIVVACAGTSKQAASPRAVAGERLTTASVSREPITAVAPLAPPSRAEIDELDRKIEQDLAELGIATSQPPACAEVGCSRPTAEQLSTGLTPPSSDATCKRSQSEQCQSSCTFSDSICTNAKRICVLADELGGTDAYANEKCARGTESCEKSRTKCCGCL